MKLNIYPMWVLIATLPYLTVHAQLPAVQETNQYKIHLSNKELPANAGIFPGWYSEAVKNIQQLEEQ